MNHKLEPHLPGTWLLHVFIAAAQDWVATQLLRIILYP